MYNMVTETKTKGVIMELNYSNKTLLNIFLIWLGVYIIICFGLSFTDYIDGLKENKSHSIISIYIGLLMLATAIFLVSGLILEIFLGYIVGSIGATIIYIASYFLYPLRVIINNKLYEYSNGEFGKKLINENKKIYNIIWIFLIIIASIFLAVYNFQMIQYSDYFSYSMSFLILILASAIISVLIGIILCIIGAIAIIIGNILQIISMIICLPVYILIKVSGNIIKQKEFTIQWNKINKGVKKSHMHKRIGIFTYLNYF